MLLSLHTQFLNYTKLSCPLLTGVVGVGVVGVGVVEAFCDLLFILPLRRLQA